VLFNANPLMRFDGYFILSDWLEIANLSQAAQRRCLTGVLRWLGIAVPENHAPGPNRFLLLYGMASFFYRLVVVGCLLYAFYQFLKWQRLEWLGFALVTVALFILAALPAYRLCRAVQQIGKVPEMKRSRVLLLAAFVGSAAAVVFLVPFRMSVHAVGLVQVDPAHQQRVVIPASGGILAQTMVRDGQRVQQGDIIAVLRNPNLELDLRLNDAEQALRGEQRQAVLSQLALFDGASSESASLAEIEQDSRTLAQQNAALKARAAALVLRAPCDGLVIGLPSWDVQGKWLAAGTTLCQIGNDSHLRLLALLEPADRQLVDANKSARLHCPCGGAAIWNGSVVSVAQVDAQEIPPQLSHRVGGDIVTTQDPVSKAEKPNKQHYLVAVRLDRADPRLQVGALGQVRIDAGASTLWWRLRKYLGSTFNWGL
jgi:putative peptide zinc metalloprotease protein